MLPQQTNTAKVQALITLNKGLLGCHSGRTFPFPAQLFFSCTVCSLSQRLNYNMHIIKKEINSNNNNYKKILWPPMLKALSSTPKLLPSTTSPKCESVQESGPTLCAPCRDSDHWTERRGTVALNHWNLRVSDAERRVSWLNVTNCAQVQCVQIWSIHLRVVFKILIVKFSSLFALNGILCSRWHPSPPFS